MGSTSYDEARDHVDATWSGASWYGPSTGEYWIVNPREYADPRKHGPDYQSRARRPAGATAAIRGREATDAAATDAPAGAARPVTSAPAPDAVDDGPTVTTPSGGDRAGTSRSRPSRSGAREWATPSSGSAWTQAGDRRTDEPPADQRATRRTAWLGAPVDDPVRRLGLALIAWPPIGLAAAALIGDATGCTTFGAQCTGVAPMLPWLAQAVLLGLLLLLPPLSRLLAAGTAAVLACLVPVTAVLIALGGAATPQAGATLIALLGAAWIAGVAWSVTRRLRVLAGHGDASGARP